MTESPSPFQESTAPNPEKKESYFTETIKFAIIALVIFLPIRWYVMQPFIVDGPSMFPTFETGNYLIVDELSYRFEDPKRGDVVILKYEYGPETIKPYFIKRIVGLPNETVEVDGAKIIIKNAAHPEGFTLNEPYIKFENYPEQQVSLKLGAGEYFVMGDNRPQSKDARIWGPQGEPEPLLRKDIVGRPLLRLFPLNQIGLFPGAESE